jgi:epoxyqueuosine reductase
MTDTPPDCCSSAGIARFFSERTIDVFHVADISGIRAPAGRHPRDLLPSCRTMILFGIAMPDLLFSGTGREQAEELKRLTGSLESTVFALSDLLERGGSRAIPILHSFPYMVEEGKLRGRLSLKHCAADAGFGTIGENTLFIHPDYGNRMALAAVITDKEMEPSPPLPSLLSCTHCNKCVTACPEGAIHNGDVDQLSCRNLTDHVPPLLRPLLWKLMGGDASARFVTILLNQVGSRVTFRPTCSACMTACPYFHKGKR